MRQHRESWRRQDTCTQDCSGCTISSLQSNAPGETYLMLHLRDMQFYIMQSGTKGNLQEEVEMQQIEGPV